VFQPNFVTFTSTKISDHAFPLEGKFRGNQNDGFTFVLFDDGSGGVIKNLKDWTGNKTGRLYPAEILAAQEVLAARVGETMNAPIRECRFYGKDGLSVIMPYIEGENGEQAGQDTPPKGHQATALVLFDYLTANADRRPKNWLWTPDHRIVGIDHALCNFRPRTPTPELISLLWNNGVSHEALLILRPKLENLRIDFTQLGMGDKHETMMQNLSHLLQAFQILDQVAVVKGGPGSGRHPELHLVSEWSHQPGKIINYDTDGNQYIIEGNDWLFKGPFPAGDYVATFGATVKSRAGGMLAQALVQYRSQGTADQSIKSPVIHILHIESNQSVRGAGFARKLVAALHDTVMPTGEAATIVHNSFTSDLGRNFANSLDPSYNQVKDEGEAAYRDPSNFQPVSKGGPGSGRHPELGKIVPAPVGNKYSVDKAVQQSMIEDTIAAVERSGEAKGKAIFRDAYMTLADENNRGIVKENLVQAIADRLAGTDFDRILGLDADRSVLIYLPTGAYSKVASGPSLSMALLSSVTLDPKDVAKRYEQGIYNDERLNSIGLEWDSTSKTIKPNSPYYRLASVKDPEVANKVRTQAVDDLVARWAKTSNDTDLTAHALQDAAEAEFGLHGTAPWTDPKPESVLDEDSMKGIRLFLRAQYEITQERLKAAGIDTLTLYRGMTVVPDGLEHGKSAEISTRPLNAFSASKQVAFDFSKGKMTQSIAGPKGKGIVISGKVPAERVLSLATTGIGCLSEQEVVVLGGTDEWMVEKGDEIQRTIYHHSS